MSNELQEYQSEVSSENVEEDDGHSLDVEFGLAVLLFTIACVLLLLSVPLYLVGSSFAPIVTSFGTALGFLANVVSRLSFSKIVLAVGVR